jgi:tetrathionate reductase subunit B
MKAFVIDIARCNGCYSCQIACKDEHSGNDWPPYSKAQPDTGQFWLKLDEYVRGTVPKVKMYYQPVLCAHCDEAPCMKACPVDGAIYKRVDGLVLVDYVKCTGCKNCIDACPTHTIYFNDSLNIAQKCTGCAHLLDNGWEVPRCVDACPTECLKFGEESELKKLIKKGTAGISGVGSRLYYLNLPGKFISGTVYDPVKKEIVAGAKCILIDKKNSTKSTTTTDGFGDFWFENLEKSEFSLEITKTNKTRTIKSINTEKDVNLGDIPLP